MKILIILVAAILFGCAQTYPKTGNAGIDLALSNQSLSHEAKMNILRRYQGQAPVYQQAAPNNPVAANYRPVVDPAVCKDCNYEADLAQCQSIASNNTNVTSSAVTNAAIGAGSAALIGAFLNVDPGHMAALGASAGGLQGVGQELGAIHSMIARCMAGRGYSVLR